MSFESLGLSDAVMANVRRAGYVDPTPIQAGAIPLIMAGEDVVGASQTGTGKTAAFALPIVTRLREPGALRCLILEPTRELAAQVADSMGEFGEGTGLRSLLMHGGVGYGHQLDALKAGIDVLVATPGRLLDHMGRKAVVLDKIEILVLDEVDRMLDMGFLPDVRKIVAQCPKDRQTLFFSATMPPTIESLAKWALRNPHEVEIGQRRGVAETVSHAFYPVAIKQRGELLIELLKQTDFHSVMVFTRTKRDADMLAATLLRNGSGYRLTVMHSDIKQADRAKALKGFRDGDFDVIIATDLAARGLDISNVSHVINFSVPENPEDYVHRIGRTGRAQREGDAFTILAADEVPFAQAIERFIGRKIERRRVEGFPYVYTTLLDDDAPNEAKLNRVFNRRPKARRRRPS